VNLGYLFTCGVSKSSRFNSRRVCQCHALDEPIQPLSVFIDVSCVFNVFHYAVVLAMLRRSTTALYSAELLPVPINVLLVG